MEINDRSSHLSRIYFANIWRLILYCNYLKYTKKKNFNINHNRRKIIACYIPCNSKDRYLLSAIFPYQNNMKFIHILHKFRIISGSTRNMMDIYNLSIFISPPRCVSDKDKFSAVRVFIEPWHKIKSYTAFYSNLNRGIP